MKIQSRRKHIGISGFVKLAFFPVFILIWVLMANTAQAQSHFTGCAFRTGSNATVAVPHDAVLAHEQGYFTLETGDEIAVFNTGKTVCAGVIVWDSTLPSMAVSVWGDNDQTPEVDGMLADEVMTWVVWDQSTGDEYGVNVAYATQAPLYPSGAFGNQRLYQLTSFAPTAVTLGTFQVAPTAPVLLILLVLSGLGLATLVLFRKMIKKAPAV